MTVNDNFFCSFCFSADSDDIIMEGFVNRKHEWESTTKRSSNR